MTSFLLRTAIGSRSAVILAVILACQGAAAAASLQIQVTNLTASGGDPQYSVASDVTFTNLVLTEFFADSTSQTLSLLDGSGVARTSLSTLAVALTTTPVPSPDPIRGTITRATLSGSLSQTSLVILTSFGGTTSNTTVLPSLNATLLSPDGNNSVDLLAQSVTGGTSYAIGTLGSATAGPSAAAVPEPASTGWIGLAMLSLAGARKALLRSRKAAGGSRA